MIRNVNTDLVAGVVGIGITTVFWFSIDPEIMRLSIMFPKAMIAILAMISAALVVRGFTRGAERRDIFDVGSNVRVLVTGIFFFGWGIAISYLGFFVSSVAAISLQALYLALARRRVTVAVFLLWVLIAAGEVTFFFLIFTRLLHVPLPTGWLF